VTRRLPVALAVFALGALAACGGGSGSNPTPIATPTPVPIPTPSPTPILPGGLVCNPTPPPLYGLKVKVLFDNGQRKTLDSRPQVINVGDYCERAGFAATSLFCFTRQETDPQATACDYMAVGKSPETGRWGPTWSYNDKACTAAPGENGCTNHPDNQFLVTTRGDGVYEACVAPDIPLSTDPDKPGSRCGRCTISGGRGC